jgi:hypothetical protein
LAVGVEEKIGTVMRYFRPSSHSMEMNALCTLILRVNAKVNFFFALHWSYYESLMKTEQNGTIFMYAGCIVLPQWGGGEGVKVTWE